MDDVLSLVRLTYSTLLYKQTWNSEFSTIQNFPKFIQSSEFFMLYEGEWPRD